MGGDDRAYGVPPGREGPTARPSQETPRGRHARVMVVVGVLAIFLGGQCSPAGQPSPLRVPPRQAPCRARQLSRRRTAGRELRKTHPDSRRYPTLAAVWLASRQVLGSRQLPLVISGGRRQSAVGAGLGSWTWRVASLRNRRAARVPSEAHGQIQRATCCIGVTSLLQDHDERSDALVEADNLRHRLGRWVERRITFVTSLLILAIVTGWSLSHTFEPLHGVLANPELAFVMLLSLQLIVVAHVVKLRQRHRTIAVFPSQVEATEYARAFLVKRRVVRAHILAFSGRSVIDIIRMLAELNAEIYILVRDPVGTFAPIGDRQYQIRIAAALSEIFANCSPGYDKLYLRLYDRVPSIRGHLIDTDLLQIGWFLPSTRPADPHLRNREAVVQVTRADPSFAALALTFQRAFFDIWDSEAGDIRSVNSFTEVGPPGTLERLIDAQSTEG